MDNASGNDSTGQCGAQASPFKSLDKAFQTCHTGPGDFTVNVAPGTYPATNNNQLPLGGAGSLVIQSTSTTSPPIFDFTTANTYFATVGSSTTLTLRYLTFLGGSSATNGGLISTEGGTVSAQNVIFNGATAGVAGGAISLTGSIGSLFVNCQFLNCATTGALHSGGAVALFNSSAVFMDTLFQNCSSQRGGAVFIDDLQDITDENGQIKFTSCTFLNNAVDNAGAGRDATLGGGAVNVNAAFQQQYPLFTGCNFTGNTAAASQGGALFLGPLTGATIDTSSFVGGNAFQGGAIYGAAGVSLTLSQTTFQGNSANHVEGETSGQGGAIYLSNGFITAVGATFTANTAGENGGAVQLAGTKSHYQDPTAIDQSNFTACLFSGNSAGATGGALAAQYLKTYVFIDNTNFLDNLVTGNGLEAGGGAIYTNTARLGIGANSLVNSFERNTAVRGMGGAIYSFIPLGADNSNPNNFNGPYIANAVFSESVASTGGAICLDGPGDNLGVTAFTNVRFSKNAATGVSNAEYGVGGAIMSWNTTYVFITSFFLDNTAHSGGGALWAGGESPSFPHMINCTFAGNNVTTNLANGVSAAFRGGVAAVFKNTHLNGPIVSNVQVDLFVGDNAIVQIAADQSAPNPDSPCNFNGFNVQDNAYLVFNCTPTVAVAYLDNRGNVSINMATRLTITENLNWNGGGFACNNDNGIVDYRNPSNLLGRSAELVNNNPKFLQKCNLAINGYARVSHFTGGAQYDLLLTEGAEIYNYGTLATSGSAVFYSQGANSFFENDGHVLIEETFTVSATQGNTFGWSSVGSDTLIFVHLFDPNGPVNPSTAEASSAAAADTPTPYTALNIQGAFAPAGLLQINFPDLYKGYQWSNIINFTSRTGKFAIHRGAIPNKKGQLIGQHLKAEYTATSLSIQIKSTANLLTGGQVFGIIFGVLTAVSIGLGAAYYFYFKKQTGPIYETIDR